MPRTTDFDLGTPLSGADLGLAATFVEVLGFLNPSKHASQAQPEEAASRERAY